MSAMLMSANDAHLVTTPRERIVEAVAVRRVVLKHCAKIGCDESNTRGAVEWALRYGTCTMTACTEGKRRAEQLRARQPAPAPTPGGVAA